MKNYRFKIGGYISPTEKGFEDFPYWDEPLLIQEKIDGCWCAAIKENGKTVITIDGVTPRTNSQLKPTIDALDAFMPDDSAIIGELGFGSEQETELAKKTGYHRFVAFDAVRWRGRDLTEETTEYRFKFLRAQFPNTPKFPSVVQLVDCLELYSGKWQTAYQIFRLLVEGGSEGIIIKRMHQKYESGTRTKNYFKVKNYITREYVLTGFTKSNAPTFIAKGIDVASVIGSIYKNGTLTTVVSASGIPDTWRKEFSDNPEKYIGKVMELGGNKVFKSGSMRHPNFIRFRNDVAPEECTYENLYHDRP